MIKIIRNFLLSFFVNIYIKFFKSIFLTINIFYRIISLRYGGYYVSILYWNNTCK